jgi:hypothetical protein
MIAIAMETGCLPVAMVNQHVSVAKETGQIYLVTFILRRKGFDKI